MTTETLPTCQSFRVIYDRILKNGLRRTIVREIIATNFTTAVWEAEHQREDNERLINVTPVS